MKNENKLPLDYQKAKDKALKLLEFRDHTKKEIREKLFRAGAENEVICEVLEFLSEYNLINDEVYAKRYANDLKNLKKFGKKRIERELINKGISKDTVFEVLSEMEETDEEELSILINKRLKGNFDKKNCDKIMRYFIYRGYSPDEIKRCIDSLRTDFEY